MSEQLVSITINMSVDIIEKLASLCFKSFGKAHERCKYRSVSSKCPLPGKHPCTTFQGVNVVASIQMYRVYILGKHPCGPKLCYVLNAHGHLPRTLRYFILLSTPINTASAHVHNLAHYVHVASSLTSILQHAGNVLYGALDLILSSVTSKD